MHLKDNLSMHQILYYTEKKNIELELREKISKLPRLAKNTKILRKKLKTGMVYQKSKYIYVDFRAKKTHIQISALTLDRCMGFPGSSDSKESACSAGDQDSVPEMGRSPGEGNGNPLQYSCLEIQEKGEEETPQFSCGYGGFDESGGHLSADIE